MIERLEKAREWASRFFVAVVIVAAVAKDHVFDVLVVATPTELADRSEKAVNPKVVAILPGSADAPLNALDVMHAQEFLISDGLYGGPIDGIFGPRTARALLRYEKSSNIIPRGLLTRNVLDRVTRIDPLVERTSNDVHEADVTHVAVDGSPHSFAKAHTVPKPSSAAVILYTLILILIYAMGEVLTELSFEKLAWLRKLVMGSDDIEDQWLDIVFQSDSVIGGGFIEITYRDGSYRINGTDYVHQG